MGDAPEDHGSFSKSATRTRKPKKITGLRATNLLRENRQNREAQLPKPPIKQKKKLVERVCAQCRNRCHQSRFSHDQFHMKGQDARCKDCVDSNTQKICASEGSGKPKKTEPKKVIVDVATTPPKKLTGSTESLEDLKARMRSEQEERTRERIAKLTTGDGGDLHHGGKPRKTKSKKIIVDVATTPRKNDDAGTEVSLDSVLENMNNLHIGGKPKKTKAKKVIVDVTTTPQKNDDAGTEVPLSGDVDSVLEKTSDLHHCGKPKKTKSKKVIVDVATIPRKNDGAGTAVSLDSVLKKMEDLHLAEEGGKPKKTRVKKVIVDVSTNNAGKGAPLLEDADDVVVEESSASELDDVLNEGLKNLSLVPEVKKNTVKLRDYQRRLVREFKVLAKGVAKRKDLDALRALLYLPTGGGKTMVAANIIEWARRKRDWKCLFIVNRDVLVDQTYHSLERVGCGDDVGFVRGGSTFDASKGIQIASIQALRQKGATMPVANLVVVDEAHCMLAKSYQDLLEPYGQSIILGMTATPFRTKTEEKLGMIFNEFLQGPSVNELVHREILVKPIMHIEPVSNINSEDGIAKSLNAFTRYCQKEKRRTICFCKDVKHARALAGKFGEMNIAAASIDAKTKPGERDIIFSQFTDGTLQVLTSVDVLSEGFDEPSVSAVMLLRPTDSKGLYIQQVGRGLRSCGWMSKANCIIVDLTGNIMKHGAVTGPRQYSLEGAPANGYKRGGKKTFQTPVRCCSNNSCNTWMHYKVKECDKCGEVMGVHCFKDESFLAANCREHNLPVFDWRIGRHKNLDDTDFLKKLWRNFLKEKAKPLSHSELERAKSLLVKPEIETAGAKKLVM
jgi:superfamily II DNA or RNA helicase